MNMTEKEEIIVNYMTNLVGTSLDKIDSSAKEMIKYNTGLLTILTALATFFHISISYVILPIVLISIGIISFIITIQPIKIKYTVGEIESSIQAYESLSKKKSNWLKIGYIGTYSGYIWFLIVLVA